MNLLNRIEFLPAFAARLKEEPEAVVSLFETFRQGRALDLPLYVASRRLADTFICSISHEPASYSHSG